MTEANKENEVLLKKILCIYYPLYFQKNIVVIKTLLDSNSKINAIMLAYASKLGLQVYRTNVGA